MKISKIVVGVLVTMVTLWAGAVLAQGGTPATAPVLQDYFKSGQMDPVPDGMATLYRVPWRSNPRIASAYEARQGLGVYYKHILANENVMQQMAAAGVRRLRLAPHHTMYIHKDWAGPTSNELANLEGEFRGCKAAGIRPCVVFVNIPIMGNNEQGQSWVTNTWKKEIMEWGAPGSDAYKAYFEKTYIGLLAVLKTARAAGFKKSESYDMEMGQNLWWGFPALPPCPALTLEALQPGGLVYEFEKALVDRAMKEGYTEPRFWNSENHHYFEKMTDSEMFPGTVGRAISVYHPGAGLTDTNFTGSDAWPKRDPLKFMEDTPPLVALCKPEGWMADFSRHDNLIRFLNSTKTAVSLTSLGVVPGDIPGVMIEKTDDKGGKTKVKAEGVDGWLIKSKGLTRSYAFWLNQGVQFVLIHSAYEGANDEMSHALIPDMGTNMNAFVWQKSRPLSTLRAFADAFDGAKKLDKLTDLKFRYALAEDAELIPASATGGSLKASDAVALLPFQINESKFAVAAYVVTPNIAVAMKPTRMTLEVDKTIGGDVVLIHPSTQTRGFARKVAGSGPAGTTTVTFDVQDDVTWLVFSTRK